MSFTNWKVRTQMRGSPTLSIKTFCQPWRDAVQMASGSLSNSTARIVAPMGPIPKKVTPMPCGKQTTCWYFHPVAKMTNSVIVAMRRRGNVRYEMRFVLSRCQGENPVSFGAVVFCELVGLEFFINDPFRI